MNSWPDGTSESAQASLDEALSCALDLARTHTDHGRSFTPFAVVIDAQGALAPVAVQSETGETDAGEAYGALCKALAANRENLRTVALVTDCRFPTAGHDAIQVNLEHHEGVAVTAMVPYHRRRLARKPLYDDTAFQPTAKRIW